MFSGLLGGTYSSAVVGLGHAGGDLEAQQGTGGFLGIAPVFCDGY